MTCVVRSPTFSTGEVNKFEFFRLCSARREREHPANRTSWDKERGRKEKRSAALEREPLTCLFITACLSLYLSLRNMQRKPEASADTTHATSLLLCKSFFSSPQSYSHLRPGLRLYLAYTLATALWKIPTAPRFNHNEYKMYVLLALIKKVCPFKVNEAQMKTHLSICLSPEFFLFSLTLLKLVEVWQMVIRERERERNYSHPGTETWLRDVVIPSATAAARVSFCHSAARTTFIFLCPGSRQKCFSSDTPRQRFQNALCFFSAPIVVGQKVTRASHPSRTRLLRNCSRKNVSSSPQTQLTRVPLLDARRSVNRGK